MENLFLMFKYLPLLLNLRRGSRAISDIPPRHILPKLQLRGILHMWQVCPAWSQSVSGFNAVYLLVFYDIVEERDRYILFSCPRLTLHLWPTYITSLPFPLGVDHFIALATILTQLSFLLLSSNSSYIANIRLLLRFISVKKSSLRFDVLIKRQCCLWNT
jgi:hypothetical protein